MTIDSSENFWFDGPDKESSIMAFRKTVAPEAGDEDWELLKRFFELPTCSYQNNFLVSKKDIYSLMPQKPRAFNTMLKNLGTRVIKEWPTLPAGYQSNDYVRLESPYWILASKQVDSLITAREMYEKMEALVSDLGNVRYPTINEDSLTPTLERVWKMKIEGDFKEGLYFRLCVIRFLTFRHDGRGDEIPINDTPAHEPFGKWLAGFTKEFFEKDRTPKLAGMSEGGDLVYIPEPFEFSPKKIIENWIEKYLKQSSILEQYRGTYTALNSIDDQTRFLHAASSARECTRNTVDFLLERVMKKTGTEPSKTEVDGVSRRTRKGDTRFLANHFCGNKEKEQAERLDVFASQVEYCYSVLSAATHAEKSDAEREIKALAGVSAMETVLFQLMDWGSVDEPPR